MTKPSNSALLKIFNNSIACAFNFNSRSCSNSSFGISPVSRKSSMSSFVKYFSINNIALF